MRLAKYSCLILIGALVLGASGYQWLSAQATRPAPMTKMATPATQKTNSSTAKQQPCWEAAGISKAAMDERRSILESKRAEVEAVCTQAGLTDQQKMEQIREINQATKQKLAGLITPEQEEKLKACNKAHAESHPAGGAAHSGGPCSQFGR
jgi:uncharacterized protein HemX